MGMHDVERPRGTWWIDHSLSAAALVLVIFGSPACNEPNPRFDEASDAGDSGGGSTGSATTDGTATSTEGGTTSADDSSTGGGASGGATTGTTASEGTGSDVTTSDETNETTTDEGPGSVEYGPSIAECVGDDDLDPDACEEYAGEGTPGFMAVDLVSDDGELVISYVAFPVDDALQGKTVTAVTLRLTTTNAAWSGSDATGEIWAVEPFTLSDLLSMQPAKVGATALSGNQGAVGLGESVSWSLPVGTALPNSTVYLGVFPVSDDGVYYWNLDGAAPPVLAVDYE